MTDVALFAAPPQVEPVVLEVIGQPRPKGSKSGVAIGRNGRPVPGARVVLIESTSAEGRRMQAQWVADVRAQARAWRDQHPGEPLDVPIAVTLTFYLERPRSAPRRVLWPAKRPDWDKLARLVCDALTGVVYRDDALICRATVEKVFAADRPAGCSITVEVL